MTVFSFSNLTLTIDGTSYTAEYLSNVTISKNIDGIGTSGISTTMLSGNVYTSNRFSQGAHVAVSYKDWEFPDYYIDDSDFNGTSVHITAYDLCKNLDLPFDTSNYTQYEEPASSENETVNNENNGDSSSSSSSESSTTSKKNKKKKEKEYDTSLVLNDLANQAGFSGNSNVSRILKIKYSDLTGSMRTVLQRLSEADCGVWYCGNDNHLKFAAFGSSSSAATINEGEHSPIIEKSMKRIYAIYAEDTRNSYIYKFGGGDYTNTLFLSGDYLQESVVQAIAEQIYGTDGGYYDYLAFSVDKAIISSNIEVCGQAYFPGKETPYHCTSITISFGALCAVASLSSAQINESKASYADKMKRLLEQRLKLNTVYGNWFVNKNGAGTRVKL